MHLKTHCISFIYPSCVGNNIFLGLLNDMEGSKLFRKLSSRFEEKKCYAF